MNVEATAVAAVGVGEDGVAVVTFDDSKVNVISPAAVADVSSALDVLETDDAVHAVVLCGRRGQFCAGYDLNTLMLGGDERRKLVVAGWELMLRLLTYPLPVVVACTGNAVAGGAALLLTGDVRFGAEGSFKIGFNEVGIGIPLPALVLELAAGRLVTGEVFAATAGARIYTPSEAAAAGFLHRVFPPDALLGAALEEARRLALLPVDAFRTTKQALTADTARRMRGLFTEDLALVDSIGA